MTRKAPLLLPGKHAFARTYGFVSADCAVVAEAAANFAALRCWSPSTYAVISMPCASVISFPCSLGSDIPDFCSLLELIPNDRSGKLSPFASFTEFTPTLSLPALPMRPFGSASEETHGQSRQAQRRRE